ncbi:MAG TPA: DUF2795 domain-containing protein [Candidatus Saccharimonadia bacterium]|nr:DUF2795 domain-containing protein [Candidatus Saccharimonadia bacterium]
MIDPNHEPKLNPKDLFAFLDGQDDYPVSGVKLAQNARKQHARPEIIAFFEALPITFHDVSEIINHTVKPNELPLGPQLDLAGRETPVDETNQDQATLQISNIIK